MLFLIPNLWVIVIQYAFPTTEIGKGIQKELENEHAVRWIFDMIDLLLVSLIIVKTKKPRSKIKQQKMECDDDERALQTQKWVDLVLRDRAFDDWKLHSLGHINTRFLLSSASLLSSHEFLMLIQAKCNVQANGNATICWASYQGQLQVVQCLIKHKARVDAQDNEPICLASINGRVEVVQCLIEHKAPVDAQNNNPILWASYIGHVDVVQCLIEHKAQADARDNTPICWASYNKHSEVVKCLLEHKARL